MGAPDAKEVRIQSPPASASRRTSGVGGPRRKSVLTKSQYLKIETNTDNPVEAAVKSEFESANALLQNFARAKDEVGLYVPESLRGAVFCGHLVADLDSIAGALGAADLYGGHPARASELNSETTFALEEWGLQGAAVPPIEDALRARGGPKARVCLVDFQQATQLSEFIRQDQIVGIIDHHALQTSTIRTTRPIFVDIRPWGSMSSILAHTYATHGKALPKPIAGMLLCAILSDTLNMRSPTTTAWDKKMVSMLVQYCGVEDVNDLCARQFKAKSQNLATMSAYALVGGDLKQFKLGEDGGPVRLAFAVVETTDPAAMIARTGEFIPELVALRAELGVDLIFLAIVDIVGLESHVLIAGRRERSLAVEAGFDARALSPASKAAAGSMADSLLHMGAGWVSRKSDFVPAIAEAFDDGWNLADADGEEEDLDVETVVVVEETPECPGGTFVRRKSLANGLTAPLVLEASPRSPRPSCPPAMV